MVLGYKCYTEIDFLVHQIKEKPAKKRTKAYVEQANKKHILSRDFIDKFP